MNSPVYEIGRITQLTERKDPARELAADQFTSMADGICGALFKPLQIRQPTERELAVAASMKHIAQADLQECSDVLEALIERVVDLVGLAPELEDAQCSLKREIEAEQGATP